MRMVKKYVANEKNLAFKKIFDTTYKIKEKKYVKARGCDDDSWYTGQLETGQMADFSGLIT